MTAQSGLSFNPATGLSSPDTSEIRRAVAEDWAKAFFDPDQPALDTAPTTPAGQLIDAETAVIEDKNAQLLYLANQFNPHVADGRWQDALGYIYFLERQFETPSVVTATLTGLSGTVVPKGALARTADGLTLASDRDVTINPDGKARVTFSAQVTGPIRIPAHSLTTIVTTIPGWDTVDNPAAGVPGRLRETRSEFERRRAASVAANAHGTVAALYSAIGNLAGVADLVVLENITSKPCEEWGVTVPAHGVFVSVYGGADAEIAEALYRKKDAGAATGGNTKISYHDPAVKNYRGGVTYACNIERPEPLAFAVKVTVRKTPSTPATIVDDIKRAVLADFCGEHGKDRVRMAAVCYASRFYGPIMEAGAQDLVSIKIMAPAGADGTDETDGAAHADGAAEWLDEITVPADRMPALSDNDIHVAVLT